MKPMRSLILILFSIQTVIRQQRKPRNNEIHEIPNSSYISAHVLNEIPIESQYKEEQIFKSMRPTIINLFP